MVYIYWVRYKTKIKLYIKNIAIWTFKVLHSQITTNKIKIKLENKLGKLKRYINCKKLNCIKEDVLNCNA